VELVRLAALGSFVQRKLAEAKAGKHSFDASEGIGFCIRAVTKLPSVTHVFLDATKNQIPRPAIKT
jgi:hypothetical protein